MALQVWLPLNGNIKNQGVSDLSFSVVSPTSSSASGKIGSCYYNNSHTTGGLTSNKTINLGSQQSMFCWVKFDRFYESSSLTGVIGQHRYQKNTGMGITTYRISETTAYLSVNTGTGSNRTFNDYRGSTVINANKWYHVGYTFDGSTIRLYVNGSLDGTFTGHSSQKNVEDYIGIFMWSLNDSTITNTLYPKYQLKGYLNDVRIYDHCLSLKEIKEISKGLVLHYPMNNCNIEANNLLNNASSYREGTPYTCTTTSKDGYFPTNMYYNNDSLGGQTVTFSVSTNKQIASLHGASESTHDKVGLWLYLKKTAYSSPDGSYDSPVNLNSSNNNFKSLGNNRYSWTYTIPSGYKGLMIRTNLYSNNGSSVSANFWDFQLEFGSKALPFSPNNWTSATVYDCSGFGYNGTANGTLITSSNTSRYNSSLSFNGSDSAITIGNFSTMVPDGNFTFNCWFHKDSWGSKGYETIFGGPSGFELEAKSSSTNSPVIVAYSWGGGSKAYSLNTWNMITMVRTTSSCLFYLNGELCITGTAGTIPSGNYFIGAWNSSTQQNYKGNISDVRIYATPLSAEDVKELYSTSAVICDNGTVMAYSLEE